MHSQPSLLEIDPKITNIFIYFTTSKALLGISFVPKSEKITELLQEYDMQMTWISWRGIINVP